MLGITMDIAGGSVDPARLMPFSEYTKNKELLNDIPREGVCGEYLEDMATLDHEYTTRYREYYQTRELWKHSMVTARYAFETFARTWHTKERYSCAEYLRLVTGLVSGLGRTPNTLTNVYSQINLVHASLCTEFSKMCAMIETDKQMYLLEESKLCQVKTAAETQIIMCEKMMTDLTVDRKRLVKEYAMKHNIPESYVKWQDVKSEQLSILNKWRLDPIPCPLAHQRKKGCHLCDFIYKEITESTDLPSAKRSRSSSSSSSSSSTRQRTT
jgi:hypothetical protein